jgi:hypothetical protein
MIVEPKRVELKINVDAKHIKAARHHLELGDADATTATIWFCDRRLAGHHAGFELFDRGLIVRLRSKDGDDSDTTVKYRRPQPLELPFGWDDEDAHPNFKIEGDWTGKNHQVSASLDTTVEENVIDDAVAAGPPLSHQLFSADQRAFANALTVPSKVSLTALQPLGPIHALRWREAPRADLDEELGAEQWTAGELVFLELSMRVKFNSAQQWQDTLRSWAMKRGFGAASMGTTKTEAVLEYFANRLPP